MSTRQAVVIINPLSGRGRQRPQLELHARLADDILTSHGYRVVVRHTTAAGDATAFAREAVRVGSKLVVAWGGDGTINETATALAHSSVALGIVPAGSGNGLAADLDIPFEPRAALVVAASSTTRLIDAGRAGDDLFFNIAGIGIDAVIAARFAERGPSQRGLTGYLQLSSAELLRYRAASYRLTIDGQVNEQRAMLIAIANGRQYGNRMFIAPGARLDDGLLEVVAVEQLSLLGIAWRLPALFRGTLTPAHGVTMRAARSIGIASSEPIPYHLDGEPRLGGRELQLEIVPAALKVRAPAR